MNTIICNGRTDCSSFAIFIIIFSIILLLHYVQRCLHASRGATPTQDLPLYTTPSMPPNTPLQQSPHYRHALMSIPQVPYEPTVCPNSSSTSESENCAICLAEFEKGEAVRVLPRCRHVYHVECIDQWFSRALHCPICRMRVVDQQFPAKLLSSPPVGISLNHHFPGAHLVLM